MYLYPDLCDVKILSLNGKMFVFMFKEELEGMARYVGQLPTPAEDFDLWLNFSEGFFCPSRKKGLFMQFVVLYIFWCSEVNLVN